MDPIIVRYQLDPTGTSPNNLVLNEPHTMQRALRRAIAPVYGAFYVESLVIVDTITQQPLTSDQFFAAELYEVPTSLYGKEVCGLIMITDPTVSDTVMIQKYQAVGGEYSAPTTAIVQLIQNLQLDNRPIAWPNIINRPSAFTPSAHFHDVGDTYGWEYVVQAIDRLTSAVLIGDDASHDAILRYIDTRTNTVSPAIATAITQAVAAAGASATDDEIFFLANS